MKIMISVDFQICISVPLTNAETIIETQITTLTTLGIDKYFLCLLTFLDNSFSFLYIFCVSIHRKNEYWINLKSNFILSGAVLLILSYIWMYECMSADIYINIYIYIFIYINIYILYIYKYIYYIYIYIYVRICLNNSASLLKCLYYKQSYYVIDIRKIKNNNYYNLLLFIRSSNK